MDPTINGTGFDLIYYCHLYWCAVKSIVSWVLYSLSKYLQACTIVKKTHQHLYILRRVRKFGMSATSLTNFYRWTTESILSGCITAWYASCSAQDHKKLQKVMNVAQSITQASLSSIDSVYTSHCLDKAASIIKDYMHPRHCLFHLLPSGKMYKSLRSCTIRLKNSFFPAAIRHLNGPTLHYADLSLHLAMTATPHSALFPVLLYERYALPV